MNVNALASSVSVITLPGSMWVPACSSVSGGLVNLSFSVQDPDYLNSFKRNMRRTVKRNRQNRHRSQ